MLQSCAKRSLRAPDIVRHAEFADFFCCPFRRICGLDPLQCIPPPPAGFARSVGTDLKGSVPWQLEPSPSRRGWQGCSPPAEQF